MNNLIKYFIGLFFVTSASIAQEIDIPESLKIIPNAKYYWSYSVERVSTRNDNIHKYIIRVSIVQEDMNGKHLRNRIKLNNAILYCSYLEKGVAKKVFFKQKRKRWIAKFRIYTNEILPLKIIAEYKNDKRIMSLTLNKGTYPGEPD
tara:strand:+ start:17777 stop:18217 length:441 start_codon:yes stop_codon:yes gene_type:complete